MDVYFAEVQVLSESSAATPVHKRKVQVRSWPLCMLQYLLTGLNSHSLKHGEAGRPRKWRNQQLWEMTVFGDTPSGK